MNHIKESKVAIALAVALLLVSCTASSGRVLLQGSGGPAQCAPSLLPHALPYCYFDCNGNYWKIDCENGGGQWISCKVAEDVKDAKGVYVACQITSAGQVSKLFKLLIIQPIQTTVF
jgi:hypothetical protein